MMLTIGVHGNDRRCAAPKRVGNSSANACRFALVGLVLQQSDIESSEDSNGLIAGTIVDCNDPLDLL